MMEELIGKLRRKEGSWVEWGRMCQELQKSGINPQVIFEQTGFEPIQQNQVIVAAQVYATIVSCGASQEVVSFFSTKGSEILYELRVLPQTDRGQAAELVLRLQLDAIEAHNLAKAIKDMSILDPLPKGFTNHPGDAVAYQVWKSCQKLTDIIQRTQLISRGLRYAYSASARTQIEQLLTHMVTPTPEVAPRLPIYRLEEGEDLPRIFAVAGNLPIGVADWSAIPVVTPIVPFGMVRYEGTCAWIGLPGWQVVRETEDGIIILTDTDQFKVYANQVIASSFPDRAESLVLLIDRAHRQWDKEGYFLVEEDASIYLRHFFETPTVKLWGRLMLVMRQRRILDETIGDDPWILEE